MRSQCPDDKHRVLINLYEDDFVTVEKVLAELVEVQDSLVEA